MEQEVKIKGGVGLGVKIFIGFILGGVLLGLCVVFSLVFLAGTGKTIKSAGEAKKQGKSESKIGNWVMQSSKSPMNDLTTVSLTLQADGKIQGWLQAETPYLVIRGEEKQDPPEVFIVTGMNAQPEYGKLDRVSVKIRLDKEPARQIEMDESTDGKALFFKDPEFLKSLVKGMTTHECLVFEFTPFNSSPATVTFRLTGLEEAIKPLRQNSGW